MFKFVIRFLGIIIIAIDSTNPQYLRMLIPDGSSQHPISQTESGMTMIHGSFIRVRGHSPQLGSYWPGGRACIEGSSCFVYPLAVGDVISIHGISDATDGVKPPFMPRTPVKWSDLEPLLTLRPNVEQYAAGSMLIRAGTVENAVIKPSNMIAAIGTFDMPGSIVTIEVTEKPDTSGKVRVKRLVLPVDSEVDFVNLPPASALGVIGGTNKANADDTHFCLHYTLASEVPKKCVSPPSTPLVRGGLDGSIKCSNSNYP